MESWMELIDLMPYGTNVALKGLATKLEISKVLHMISMEASKRG